MKTCDARPTYKITRFGTKILCSSVEEYDTVKTYLTESKCEFYTHDKPCDRPYRVVLRGLPLADPNSIMDRMKKEHGLTPLAIHIIRRNGECAELDESFYLVHFTKRSISLKQLRNCPKRAEYIKIRQQANTSNQPGRHGSRKSLPVPVLNEKNFPSNQLSSGVQIPAEPASTSNAWNNRQKDGRRIDPRDRARINDPPSDPSEGSTDTLYGFDELWTIYNEFCDRLKQCKTKSDQVRVLGFMVCKYGVN
jgi:hypothetical protein